MKFIKKTAKYTLFGHKRGQDVLKTASDALSFGTVQQV
jgi:hypothetical protein